jgi:hypothetical protein
MNLLRRLNLRHDGKTFLERWGLVHDRVGGFYVHRIDGPDPGLDLHDHPWSFVTIVLRGGYIDLQAHIHADGQHHDERMTRFVWGHRHDRYGYLVGPRIHRMPLDVAHRIMSARPGTWTLVLRGPTRRVWGFYPPEGRVEWTTYDYDNRQPSASSRR